MTKHEIAVLASRLLAVYGLFQILRSFGSIGSEARFLFGPAEYRSAGMVMLLCTLVMIGLTAVLSVVLWVGAEWIARMILPGGPPERLGVGQAAERLEALAFSAVGLFILVPAIPRLTALVVRLVLLPQGQLKVQFLEPYWYSGFWATVAECVMGCLLLLGPRWWARIVNALRGGDS